MLLIFFFVNKILKNGSYSILLVITAVGLLWIKEVLNITSLPFQRLPFKIDSALIALMFFFFLYLYKDKILTFMKGKANLLLVALIVVVSAVLCVYNGWSNINSLDFGRIRLLYYPIALMGIASVCLVSQVITKLNWKPLISFLTFYGKNSLLIFGFQSLLIRLYLLTFNNLGGAEMQLYGFNPWIHQIGSFLSVTVLIAPLVVLLFSTLRKIGIRVM